MSPRAIRISDLPASVRRKLDASERGPSGARTYPEHEMQSAFFRWVRSPEARAVYPGLDVCYAVPNAGGFSGGYRANVARVARLRAEGVEPGPPDVNLDAPRKGFAGLRIEFNAGKNRHTPAQLD